MMELIVLGTIPGTNIQIDFTFWVYMTICFIVLFLLLECRRHRRSLNHWLAGYVMGFMLSRNTKHQHQTA